MSTFFHASESSSPNLLVRSSEASAESKDVFGSASTTKSTAITPTALARHNGADAISNPLADNASHKKHVPDAAEGFSISDHHEGSDPNTPRLPPARNGSNDLESIPQEAAARLDFLGEPSSIEPSPSASTRKHNYPVSGPQIGTTQNTHLRLNHERLTVNQETHKKHHNLPTGKTHLFPKLG